MDASNLMIIGTMAIDAVETPFGKKEKVFGGSASYAAFAASFFFPSSIVSIVGDDFPKEYRALLEKRAIDLGQVEVRKGKTFHWRGRYGSDLNVAETLDTQINVLADLHPKLNGQSTPGYVFLANVDPSVQLELLDQLEHTKVKLVAADSMNFWIEGARPKLDRVLTKISMLLLNDGEARLMTGETSLIRAARKIQSQGPSMVIIKKGEHGVLLFFKKELFVLPAFPLEEVFDPTGAGDTFGGAVMGYLAREGQVDFETLKRAVAYGTVLASFTVERFGLERLETLSEAELEERLALFKKMCTLP